MPHHDPHFASVTYHPASAARVHLEPTLTRDGTLDGAWWPRSVDLRRELPILIRALEAELGPILRVRVDLSAWGDVPAHLVIDGRFVRVSGFSGPSDTIRIIRGNQDGFMLLVIPPHTTGPTATAAMSTAARTGNTLSATEILTRCRPSVPGTVIRPYREADQPAVLALIEADRLPGQPVCTPELLDAALSGTSVHDPVPWAGLDHPTTQVMADPDGLVVGVVSYTVRHGDGAGLLLWLHGREIVAVVETLVGHALHALDRHETVYAFMSALGLGLAALPTERRPVTRKVLEHAGFTGRNSWRYLRRARPAPEPAAACPLLDVVSSTSPPGWWLKARNDDLAAEVVAQAPVGGTGVLWWFGADPAHADQALEREMLRQSVCLLHEHGAAETVLYAHGDPTTREPAGAVFEAAGFEEIDRLVSYALLATTDEEPC
jgi:ribosomal protein S18 acetylase RimI-like enzyme